MLLGVLLSKWGVTNARTVLEANGFDSPERIRDVLDIEDLSVLQLPLATRKLLSNLIHHLAEEKEKQCSHALCHSPAILKCNRCKTVSYCGEGECYTGTQSNYHESDFFRAAVDYDF